jgi:hypothetical protein
MNLNALLHLDNYTEEGDIIDPKIERLAYNDVPPLPDNPKDIVREALNSSAMLMAAGMRVDLSKSEEAAAVSLFKLESEVTMEDIQNPAIIIKLSALLNEYDHKVVRDADQIRQYATNKLLELSDHKNPSTQLKAIELLGKISDVGLFAERSVVTIQHQETSAIQEKLKKTIEILLTPNEYKVVTEAETEEVKQEAEIEAEVINEAK